MKLDDLCYMRKGKQVALLSPLEGNLLKTIEHKGPDKHKALLLLHGFSSSPAVFRKLIPQIKGYDAIICPVLPGHAMSIADFSKVRSEDWIEAVHQNCQRLINEYQVLDVLGFSLGGLLACELSQHYPLHKLYLLAPALQLNVYTPLMLKLAAMLKILGFKHIANAGGNLLSKEAEITYKSLPLNTVIEAMRLIQNYQGLAPTCPMEVFLGKYDKVVSSPKVFKLLKSLPNAKIHWLNNSAHILPLDNDYEEIIQCINRDQE